MLRSLEVSKLATLHILDGYIYTYICIPKVMSTGFVDCSETKFLQ